MSEDNKIEDTEYMYTATFCFDWDNTETCIEFNIQTEDLIENKTDVIEELAYGANSIVELDDGVVVNLSQFKQAWLEPMSKDSIKKNNHIRIVH